MKAIAIGVGISLLGASSPALACGGEDFHDYVLLDQPPPETVSGMILLKVSAPGPKLGFPPAPVEGVIEHASDTALIGKSVTIRMTGWSSCTYWAESPTAAYTLGRLREDGNKLTFEPRPFLGTYGRRMQALEQSLRRGRK